ncbi:MAG: response regulator transcription factor [Anaerolineaceae bacterium]|nr:response regulator transcription factor [Anaerolineaceae bacterium]
MNTPSQDPPDPIRVMIVDDHAVVRSGLAAFLSAYDDFDLVGEAGSGEQALAACERFRPDVILMDLMMPGMDGAAATRTIRERHPEIQVIALTSFKEQELVRSAVQAGAIGYLLKNVTANELACAIRSAFAGKPTLAQEAAQALIQVVRRPVDTPGYDLTRREKEVLALMAQGLNNQQIAEKLVVSLPTAKFHVSSVLSKLGAVSRTEAVAIALQNHLVQ